MNLTLQNISKIEFNNLNVPIIFDDVMCARCFAVLSNSQYTFKFSWRSDLIMPEIMEVGAGIYSLGIDQNISIIDFNTNIILLNLELTYFFYEVVVLNFIYVITELELLRIDKHSFNVVEEIGLPDIFVEMSVHNNKMEIKCMDGSIVLAAD